MIRRLQLEMMGLASFIVVYVLLVSMSMMLRLEEISLENRTYSRPLSVLINRSKDIFKIDID